MLSEKDNFQQSHLTLLRQQILQDAISGKLTADWRTKNPDIEPASKLLEKIKAEKEKLIAEKKIKKEKPLPKVAEDEIPFELPEKWEWCRFGEIGFSNIGVTYKPSDVSSSGVPILRSNNIQSGKIDLSSMVYIKTSVPNNKMLNIGDLLFCARNGSSRLVGKSALIKKDGFSFGAFMTKLSVLLMSAHFSFYYAQSILFFSQINDKKSTGINQLTQSTLNNMLIPIPPFTEQKAIVAKIEKLMEHVFELEEKIKQNKQDAEMLMQSFLVEAFKN
jgi:type I restriction enzyme S subunit